MVQAKQASRNPIRASRQQNSGSVGVAAFTTQILWVMIQSRVKGAVGGDLPIALGEKIVLPVHMDHAVLQNALPFILHSCDLE